MIKALWLIGFITLVISGTVYADINLDNANTAWG